MLRRASARSGHLAATAAEAAGAAAVAGGASAAESSAGGEVPVLVQARAQALLIGGERLVLALGVLALARARGLDPGPAAGLFAFGCGALLFAGLGVAAFISATRVVLWERELHGRLLAERGRGGRIFVRAG